jgi:hypothetical protein
MFSQDSVKRLADKSPMQAIQVELQQGYALSPVEAKVLAHRLQQLIDEQTGYTRRLGQIIYQAIDLDDPPGKPLNDCRKVAVQLTIFDPADAQILARDGPVELRRMRVHRLVHEALLQGGALSQEDLACLLGVSLRSIKRIFGDYRRQGTPLQSRGELKDMGRGVSHKIPVIRRYVQDLSLSEISRALGNHGIESMVRYLRHFVLVMILTDRGLTTGQMQSVMGISTNLIEQYRQLYADLDTPEHQFTLQRLKRQILDPENAFQTAARSAESSVRKKGGVS